MIGTEKILYKIEIMEIPNTIQNTPVSPSGIFLHLAGPKEESLRKALLV
jgi:hypothetical protein